MSYLNPLRAHFSGIFLAAPSTVNNDIRNFDIDHFNPANGSWNPKGNGAFDLPACTITSAFYGDGSAAQGGGDVVLGLTVAHVATPSAKVVDLDPQQQMVSMIFGLEISIAKPGAPPLLTADFTPVPFADLWLRAGQQSDGAMGVFYQSQLDSLRWGEVSSSRFLQELKAAATDGVLSIKFNLDGYSMAPGPNFTKGRITGTIGPASRAEPKHFVLGRHLEQKPPNGALQFCAAVLNESAGKIHLDLGNCLPTNLSAGAAPNFRLSDVGPLSLGFIDAGGQAKTIDPIDYKSEDFYMKNAGIIDLPAGRSLTAAEIGQIRARPLAIVGGSRNAAPVLLSEPADGNHLRADQFVARLNAGDTYAAEFRATRFGTPVAGATVSLAYQARNESPPVNTPASTLPLPAPVKTDSQGIARFNLTAANPSTPRRIIDGQVFFVDYTLDGAAMLNDSSFLSVLVWDDFKSDDPPTWHGSMRRIFALYANLYPFMKKFFDMSNYESVCDNADQIRETLSLPITHPHYMPVTRDLSESKKSAMIRWLSSPGADGKPLLGAPAGAPLTAAMGAALDETNSKTRALMRTMAARRRS